MSQVYFVISIFIFMAFSFVVNSQDERIEQLARNAVEDKKEIARLTAVEIRYEKQRADKFAANLK